MQRCSMEGTSELNQPLGVQCPHGGGRTSPVLHLSSGHSTSRGAVGLEAQGSLPRTLPALSPSSAPAEAAGPLSLQQARLLHRLQSCSASAWHRLQPHLPITEAAGAPAVGAWWAEVHGQGTEGEMGFPKSSLPCSSLLCCYITTLWGSEHL